MTLESRAQPIHGNPTVVTAFAALQTIGLIGSLLVLCTVVLSSRVKRYSTWISFNVSWIFMTLTYLLLFISGEQTGSDLGSICVLQSALVYSIPVLGGSTGLALCIQIWQTVSGYQKVSTAILIGAPYVSFLIMTLGPLIKAGTDTSGVRMDSGLYCGLISGVPGDVSAALVIVMVVITVSYEIRIFKLLLDNRRRYPDSNESSISIPIVIRVAVFNLFGILTVASGAVFLTRNSIGEEVGNLVIASLPVAWVLVFGTQTDIVRAWMFWKHDEAEDVEEYKGREGKV